ncbi:MAG: peptide-methionine (S)-S-oxide reductase MsrA [Candidatus Thermoplasmatota archaeon]|nr:peptide-methionine (S)-S-oxide reductase MsrA [Euryarchaeota archaeon]MBU4032348.1 peptide-methionine (S)-S-oxide reductase MsrA [Candidatus Thermoplasmatota archaeon]MBU4071751.1 peptide-methionine (S)-S-oxide reductase MsrA [Candidatus Thermoplasmatota archaeon]MBU4144845.1 peptide-methionine (S)-S-oxide reductase MsrA [Candidatus Thermoplasmatota archaeon]MBU4592158.1 peptide-methionine (S)-S-oxide reductase MsrA [Candidatus Thermoplasmatota archaeon]
MEQVMFAAGCFWGVEQYFRQVPGVLDAVVGYSGGKTRNPSYEDICTGRTGHAEVVHLVYDPEKVSFPKLLEHFWEMHDPTTFNRQGPDVGTQYRSAIFYYTGEQRNGAMDSMAKQTGRTTKAIVTELAPAGIFWPAEEYHQRYFEKNPGRGCHI